MPPVSDNAKNKVSKVISQEILKSLNNMSLKDVSDKDLDKIVKNYLLNTFTSQLKDEIKKATTDIVKLKETWLSTLNSESTKKNYKHNVDEFLSWLNQKSPIEVKAIDADNYLIYLKNAKYSEGTIRFKIASASSFFSFLIRHDVVNRNYFYKMKLPERQIEKKQHEDIPTVEDIEIIENELRQNLNATGRGSAGRIRASKIMLVAMSIMKTTANRVGALPHLKIDKNGNYSAKSKGTIATGKILPETISLLNEFDFDKRQPLKSVKVSTIKKYFEIICTKLYKDKKIVKIYSPHNLKHFAAISFWESCKDIYKLKVFLHHKSIATSQIYLSSLNLD